MTLDSVPQNIFFNILFIIVGMQDYSAMINMLGISVLGRGTDWFVLESWAT